MSSKAKIFLIIRLTFFLALFVLGTTICLAQDARITKMSSETDDSIEFQISVDKPFIVRGDDIKINYSVKNKSSKNVYLVIQSPPFVRVMDSGEIKIYEPVGLADDHDPYNYEFIKIAPNRTYKGILITKATVYIDSKKYAFDVNAEIQVGFSYLFDISSQKDCKEKDYQYFCLSDLYEEAKSLTIGNLVIDINDK